MNLLEAVAPVVIGLLLVLGSPFAAAAAAPAKGSSSRAEAAAARYMMAGKVGSLCLAT